MKAIRSNNSGFTLIELLTAIVISGFVVGFAGWALLQMLQFESKATESTDAMVELNRAVDYMIEEVKLSNKIRIENAGQRLVLERGDSNKTITYEQGLPEQSVWKGPRVIRRKEGSNSVNVLIDKLDGTRPFQECSVSGPNLSSNIIKDTCVQITLVRGEKQVKSNAVTELVPPKTFSSN